jgi:hypothetical protein
MSNKPSVTSGSQPDFICGSNGDITTREATRKHEDHLAHNKRVKLMEKTGTEKFLLLLIIVLENVGLIAEMQ